MSIVSMRKRLLAVATILCCATAATVFTACGDDDNNSSEQQDEAKPANVTLDVSLMQTTDMLEYCDISIEYNDGTGAKTENVADTTWTKTFAVKLPATITVKKTVAIKADKDLASVEDTINSIRKYAYGYSLFDATGKTTATVPTVYGNEKLLQYKGKLVAKAIAKGAFNQTLTIVFGTDGKPQVSEALESRQESE